MTWQTNSPDDAFRAIHNKIRFLQNHATGLRAKSAAGNLTRVEAADFSTILRDARVQIQAALAVPGLDAYARTVRGESFDVASEGAAIITAINGMQSWICGPTTANPTAPAGNYPVNGGGFLLEKTWGPDGAWTFGTFTAAATAGFRTQVDAFLAGLT